MIVLATVLAGGLGALSRVEMSAWLSGTTRMTAWSPLLTPIGVVNVVGTVLLALLLATEPTDSLAKVAGTGFLGGFTTFSTWMVQAQSAPISHRLLHVVVPLTLALLAAVAVQAT